MTVRAALVGELFRRCRDEQPDVEWIEGYPGDNPPRRRVWVFEIEGPISYPTASTQLSQDDFDVTLHAESDVGGQSRAQAMADVEAWLTTVLRVLADDPSLGGEIDPGLASTPGQMSGPYSEPNQVEIGGFAGAAQLILHFESRPTTT